MKKIWTTIIVGFLMVMLGVVGLYGVYVAHMNKVQHDQMQNATTNSAATNVVVADTNVRVLKFTVRMHLTNEVPARPTNGTSGR